MKHFAKAKEEWYLWAKLLWIIDAPEEFFPNNRWTTQFAVWDKKALVDESQLKQIREQANKKGLPVKETQPTKQVPEAKNIEEDLLAEARKAVDIFVDELWLTKAEAQQEVSDMVKYSMTIEDLKDFDDFMWIYENNIHKLARDKWKQYDIDKFIPQLRKIREQANKNRIIK